MMEYRRLGGSGLQVGVLSFGSWVTFGSQLDTGLAKACLTAAREGGVNFFDNAEQYAGGESERIMGRALAELGWPRYSYVVSTKLFWGIHEGVNMQNTLNRKYLLQAIDGSLERMGLDFVDLLFCHRSDPLTPIEETVWAMHDIVSSGRATYWGTSEWPADDLRAAFEIAERHHLHKPVMEQSQYNLLERKRVEFEWLRDIVVAPETNARVPALLKMADEFGCTAAQLAIAWCTMNPHVSTVITGASRVEQVEENLRALDVVPLLTPEVMARLDTTYS